MKRHLTKFPPHFFSYWLKLFFIMGSFSVFLFLFYDQALSEYFHWVIEYNGRHPLIGWITDWGDAADYLVLICILWIWLVVLLPKIPSLQGWNEKAMAWKSLINQVLIAIIVAGIPLNLIKVLAGRQRPHCSKVFDPYCFKPFAFGSHFHSFPSGHSEFIFCLMTILSFKWRRFREIFFFFAIMIALSRAFLGQHFLSDVVMGSFLGCFGASVSYYLFRHRWPLHGPQVEEVNWAQ
jgi:membrane-associated phospholipid phosphatase